MLKSEAFIKAGSAGILIDQRGDMIRAIAPLEMRFPGGMRALRFDMRIHADIIALSECGATLTYSSVNN